MLNEIQLVQFNPILFIQLPQGALYFKVDPNFNPVQTVLTFTIIQTSKKHNTEGMNQCSSHFFNESRKNAKDKTGCYT